MERVIVTLDGQPFEGFDQDGSEYAITEFGAIWVGRGGRVARIARSMLQAAPDEGHVAAATAWLMANTRQRRTLNKRVSSYGLKHYAERDAPTAYITNGALILAALRLGFQISAHPDSPNVYFNIALRDARGGFSGASTWMVASPLPPLSVPSERAAALPPLPGDTASGRGHDENRSQVMAKHRRGLSLERHREIGAALRDMRDTLAALTKEMGDAYPTTEFRNEQYRHLRRALGNIRFACVYLDDRLFQDHPAEHETEIYLGKEKVP